MKMEEKSFVSTSVFMALDLTYHYLSKFDSGLPGLCGGLCINTKSKLLLSTYPCRFPWYARCR